MPYSEPKGVVELLAAMVSIDSVNAAIDGSGGGEEKLADYLACVARSFGFSVRRLPVDGASENLLVRFDSGEGRPWLLFDSHMDTVSVDNMSIPPFGAEVRDGRLWGRGACDTKGSGAAMLWALHAYAQGGNCPNNVAILFSSDEEVAMHGIRSFIERDYPAFDIGKPGVVVGEPTRLRLVIAHNGLCRMRLRTTGVAAHASNPAAGRSAISAMAGIITGLERGYIPSLDRSHELTGRAQCSINTIRGGTATNIIPDRCEAEIDRRMVPGEDSGEVISELRAAIAEILRKFPVIDFELDPLLIAPPLRPPAASKLAEAAGRALSAEGLPPGVNGATYATNGGELSRKGVDAIVLGPGDIAQAHTRDEWIDLDELRTAVRVYQRLMAGA